MKAAPQWHFLIPKSHFLNSPMLSLADARAVIAENVTPLACGARPLAEARGRVLREEVRAPEDLPAFDRSAMDGYAIGHGDASEKFRVVAELQPGALSPVEIQRGECARIFTGAAIPAGASAVLPQEDVERDGAWMIPRRREAATWIRRRGEDARRGDLLLAAGGRLQAGELSLLAQLGWMTPRVSPAPRVRHFATGNELADPATTPATGQIRDSNSTLVAALLAECGAHLVAQQRCGDTLETLVAAIAARPQEDWDAALISGGASVGDYDFGARALERLGFTIHFRQLNLRPGKPLIFATRERQIAFVIPGNPVSHFVTFHVAIRLALECLEAAAARWPLVELELAEDLPAKPNPRETWWPARLLIRDGVLQAQPLAWQSSGDGRGLVSATGLLPIAPGAAGARKGERVSCLLLRADW